MNLTFALGCMVLKHGACCLHSTRLSCPIAVLQFTDEHGEVCPANWQPGEDTIKPERNASQKYFSTVDG